MLYTIYENYIALRLLEIEADSPEEAIQKAKESDWEDWHNEPEDIAITEQLLTLTLPVEKGEDIVHVVEDRDKFIFLDHNFEELEKALKTNNDGE